MSVLAYTYTQLQDAAKHAAAKSGGFDTGNSPGDCANAALDLVARAHPWAWRLKVATVTVSNAATTVDLPADCSELVSVRGAASPYLTKRVRRVTPDMLDQIRQQATAVAADAKLATVLFYAVTGKTQASATAVGTYQLEIHPAAPSLGTNALRITYRRQPAVMSGSTDKADVPTEFQDLVLAFTRAIAMQREGRPTAAAEWAAAMALMDVQRAQNDRVAAPDEPAVSNVIDDAMDVSSIPGSYS